MLPTQSKPFTIHRASVQDAPAVAALAALLWDEHSAESLTEEFTSLLQNRESAVFLVSAGPHSVGFAQCQLRHDYVEGTSSSPVGYLEGIFVLPEYRGQGCARQLLNACERWAGEMGCREFASDCELDNAASLAFHLKAGFTEVNRIICFTKTL